ncbi:hypothetical protein Clacol_001074 [Clathrus columnatus]|uniref:Uncharacterized protein n=1 Tax=Clathrus columnatus TaxID=1419009 RepID=A0AAV5A0Y8_9AGAM|nr:hypothetical protein Clacol_001074 [Clathrus columnatus]
MRELLIQLAMACAGGYRTRIQNSFIQLKYIPIVRVKGKKRIGDFYDWSLGKTDVPGDQGR